MNFKNTRTRIVVAGLLATPLIAGSVVMANAATGDAAQSKPGSVGHASAKLEKGTEVKEGSGSITVTNVSPEDLKKQGFKEIQPGPDGTATFSATSKLTDEGKAMAKDGEVSGTVTAEGYDAK